MLIILYNFAKRRNSTKQPDNRYGVEVTDVQLKEETSFIHPTLILSADALGSGFSPTKFNYVSIPYWQRHYFVKDWRYKPPYWEVDLEVDTLASFKYAIGETSAYILRAESDFNGNITDSLYPATNNVEISKIQISSEIYHTSIPAGCYVLGVINNDQDMKVGSITYYAMDADQIAALLHYMFSGNIFNLESIDDISEGLFKTLFNPFQYLTSCVWFPFPASTMGTETRKVKCAYWEMPFNATVVRYVVTDPVGFKTNLPIPLHPQTDRGYYLNHAPFTRLTAYYPPFGEIVVDPSFMQYGNNNYLYGKMFIDYITGLANCYLTITDGIGNNADPYKYMTMRSAQIGVPIQLSQVNTDYNNVVGAAGGAFAAGAAIAAVASGGASAIAAVAPTMASIKSALDAATPKTASQGVNGSFIEITEPPYLIVEHYLLTDENKKEYGRPLCSTRKIKTLSGFVLCSEADHDFPCTDIERQILNQFMKSGFYFE